MTIRLTSREFNQDTGGAKRAAATGPVFITDRGRPSHVLMTFEDFSRLAGCNLTIGELLSQPSGIEGIEFEPQPDRTAAIPAQFD